LTVVEESATFPFVGPPAGFQKNPSGGTTPKFWKIYKALPSAKTHPKRGGVPPACPFKNRQNFKGSPRPPPKEGRTYVCFTKVKFVNYKYES